MIESLKDPEGLLRDTPKRFSALKKKLNTALTLLATKPENGGHPFLFAIAAPKPHFLKMKMGINGQETAATNGKAFFWNPDFLERLAIPEIFTIMMHEVMHVYCLHCTPHRMQGANPFITPIAIDYEVNCMIEKDHKDQHRKGELWGGNIGTPLTLETLVNLPAPLSKEQLALLSPEEKEKYEAEQKKYEHIALVDTELYGKTSEWIHDEILRRAKHILPLKGFDSHIDIIISKYEAIQEMIRAADICRRMQGNVPGAIEDMLKELEEPTISLKDYVKHTFQRRQLSGGDNKDYKRFRRRPMAYEQYVPKTYDSIPRWICLMDTSGSMSIENICFGISQLKSLGNESDGIVIPVDCKVYWEAASRIENMNDLSNIKVVGRGGTDYIEFFTELELRYQELDAVIVLTDGGFSKIPANLSPSCDVIWVCSDGEMEQPSFGRVFNLNRTKKL